MRKEDGTGKNRDATLVPISGAKLNQVRRIPSMDYVPIVLIVGLMLWIGVLSDPSGKLKMPGMGSIFYVAAVIGAAAFLVCADRNRDSSGKNHKFKPEYKKRRNATAK